MNEIKLELTIDETNLVLEALGNLPFSRVYVLIAKIQEQASQQVQSANGSTESPHNSSPKDQANG